MTEEEKRDAALRRRILSALRKLWMLYGENRKECLLKGRRPNEGSNKNLKWEYQCSKCYDWFPQSDIKVDHVHAVGGLPDWGYINTCVNNLFFGQVQLLCKADHNIKSSLERGEAARKRKEQRGHK